MLRELRERIQSGAYLVDPALVAEAMIGRMTGDRASAVLVPPQSLDGQSIAAEDRCARALLDQA
jgi:hypothetical protein